MRAFGFTNPILADPQGNLIAGHGRLRAAREMGLAEVPVIELGNLTEAQKKALRLADNKIALNAGWDLEILKLELADLSLPEIDIDLGLTGFSLGEIDVVLADTPDPDDEVIPAVPASPKVRPGDIWQLGAHRVGCGDGRDAAFLALMIGQGVKIDCAFLDPPYNVKINGHVNAKGRHREFAMASGEMSEAEFRAFLGETLDACAAVSRDGAVHFVCMDWRHMDDVQAASRTIYSVSKTVQVLSNDGDIHGDDGKFHHGAAPPHVVPGAQVDLADPGRSYHRHLPDRIGARLARLAGRHAQS